MKGKIMSQRDIWLLSQQIFFELWWGAAYTIKVSYYCLRSNYCAQQKTETQIEWDIGDVSARHVTLTPYLPVSQEASQGFTGGNLAVARWITRVA